jgi:hypothetical protein
MIKNFISLFVLLVALFNVTKTVSGPVAEDHNTARGSPLIIATEPRFAGFSNNAVAADAGLAGMHAACRSSYGAGARMCLDIEVFKTPGLKSVSSVDKGWLQPTSYLSGDNPGALSCNGWSVSTGSAATWLTGDMQIIYGSKHYGGNRYDSRHRAGNHCEGLLPVVCCK